MSKKITVIGAGSVGSATAFALAMRNIANEIVIIDINEDRALGEAMDIHQGTPLLSEPVNVYAGKYEAAAGSDIVVITSGVGPQPGQTRMDLVNTNVNIIKSITPNLVRTCPDATYVIVANPVDILTYVFCKMSGIPEDRVIGSGTSLDTALYRYALSRMFEADISDIDAYILGEHGDSQVPIWSNVSVGGLGLDEFSRQSNLHLDKELLSEWTKDAGAEVIGLKGATFYGIGMAVSSIVESIVKDKHTVLPVAHVLDESFGEWAGVAISLPCRVGSDGIEKTFRLPLTAEEKEQMDRSVNTLREFQNNALHD